MKIRNIDIYLKERIGKSYGSVASLVNSDDLLLTKLSGERRTIENFRSNVLEQLTSFANDAYNQIFFELVQNAKDAESSGLWIYFASEDGILFINNGDPFHTDVSNENGSLYSFLGKAVGEKETRTDKSGKYGKGSKLLYNLLVPRNEPNGDTKSDSKRLAHALLNEHRAPILFSWTDGVQLSEFKEIESIDNIKIADELDEKSPIFCKLFLSYFPLLPKQKVKINGSNKTVAPFSSNEFKQLKRCLINALGKFESDELLMYPGTALFIPSPADVISELESAFIKENIAAALKQTCTVVAQDGRIKMNKVYINDDKYSAVDSYNFGIEVKTKEDTHNATIVFPKEADNIDSSQINFFTDYFPISNEKHGLGYIVCCKDFSPSDNRQQLKDSNQTLLNAITQNIHNDWSDWLKEPLKYLAFIAALSKSKKPEREFIRDFHQKIIEKASGYIPTNLKKKSHAESEKILILPESHKEIDISQFGDFFGLHPKLYPHREQIKQTFNIEELSLSQLFHDVEDKSKIASFFRGLTNLQMIKVWKTLDQENQTELLLEVPLIPNTNNSYSSINDFVKSSDHFFCYPEKLFPLNQPNWLGKDIVNNKPMASFDALNKLSYPNLNVFFRLNWNSNIIKQRLIALQPKIASGQPLVKQRLVKALIQTDEKSYKEFLSNQLAIFHSNNNEPKPLSQLLRSSAFNLKSGLIEDFCIKAEEQIFDIIESLLCPRGNYWKIVTGSNNLEHFFQDLQATTADKLSDLLELYKSRVPQAIEDNSILSNSLNILYCAGSWVAPANVFLSKGMCNLDKESYRCIEQIFRKSDWKILDYDDELMKILSQPSFQKIIGGISIRDSGLKATPVTLEQIAALKKLTENDKEKLFDLFSIREASKGYEIFDSAGVQYTNAEVHLDSFLMGSRYIKLPKSIWHLFSSEHHNLIDASSNSFIDNLITEYGAVKLFTWSVERCNANTKKNFVDLIPGIEIDTSKTYEQDSFEVKLLNVALSLENYVETLKTKVIIDGTRLTEIAVNNDIRVGKNQYSLSDLVAKYSEATSINKVNRSLSKVDNKQKLKELLKTNSLQLSDIVDEIINHGVTSPIVFCFLVDIAENDDKLKPRITEFLTKSRIDKIDLVSTLDVAVNKKINLLLDYWDAIPGNEKIREKIIPQNKPLWLPCEIVSSAIEKWMSQSKERKDFFEKMLINQSSMTSIEECRSLLKEEHFINNSNLPLFKNTLQWASGKNITIDEKYASSLTNKIVQDDLHRDLILVFESWRDKDKRVLIKDNAEYILEPESIKHSHYLINSKIRASSVAYANANVFDDLLASHPQLKKLEVKETLDNQKTSSQEWEDTSYKKWKTHKKNNFKYQIHITGKKVPFRYTLLVNKEEQILKIDNVGSVGRSVIEYGQNKANKEIKIYVHEKSLNNDSVLGILEAKQTELFLDKKEIQDLVRLLSIKNQENSEIINSLKSNGINTVKDLNVFLKGSSPQNGTETGTEGNTQIDGLDQLKDKDAFLSNLDQLKALFEKHGKEVFDKMVANMENTKEIDEDSKPNPLSGYIGEQFFQFWLKHRNSENVRWVANKKAAYDIEFGANAKVEVKTKIKTLYDDTLTFRSTNIFLRESQFDYIESNSNQEYYLAIISLTDLGLKEQYATWFEQYKGTDEYEEEQKRLQNDLCNEINDYAEKYMESEAKRDFFIAHAKYLKVNNGKTSLTSELPVKASIEF